MPVADVVVERRPAAARQRPAPRRRRRRSASPAPPAAASTPCASRCSPAPRSRRRCPSGPVNGGGRRRSSKSSRTARRLVRGQRGRARRPRAPASAARSSRRVAEGGVEVARRRSRPAPRCDGRPRRSSRREQRATPPPPCAGTLFFSRKRGQARGPDRGCSCAGRPGRAGSRASAVEEREPTRRDRAAPEPSTATWPSSISYRRRTSMPRPPTHASAGCRSGRGRRRAGWRGSSGRRETQRQVAERDERRPRAASRARR